MDTYIVQINDSKALRLLRDLEDLKIIKVLRKSNDKKDVVKEDKASSLRGALNLNASQYKDFQKHANDIRKEWA